MKNKIFTTLKSLQKTIDTYWNIGEHSGQFLNLLIKSINCKTALEIGTSNGYSGIWITEALAENNGRLYTIESHKKKRFSLATTNFKKAGLTKNITQILGHAPEAIPYTPKFFDLILMDATKYEYCEYLKALTSRTKKNSIIIADNVVSHQKELNSFIKKISASKNFKTFLLNIGKGLLIAIRTS